MEVGTTSHWLRMASLLITSLSTLSVVKVVPKTCGRGQRVILRFIRYGSQAMS